MDIDAYLYWQIETLKEITSGIDNCNLSTLLFDTFYPCRLNAVRTALNYVKTYIETTYKLNYPDDIKDTRNRIVNLIDTLDDLNSSINQNNVTLIKKYNDELKDLL